MYFSFDCGWYYFHLDIVCKNRRIGGGGGEGFRLTEKSIIKRNKTYLSIVPNFGPKK